MESPAIVQGTRLTNCSITSVPASCGGLIHSFFAVRKERAGWDGYTAVEMNWQTYRYHANTITRQKIVRLAQHSLFPISGNKQQARRDYFSPSSSLLPLRPVNASTAGGNRRHHLFQLAGFFPNKNISTPRIQLIRNCLRIITYLQKTIRDTAQYTLQFNQLDKEMYILTYIEF